MANYAIGDEVRLKTANQAMTVMFTEDQGNGVIVSCAWFDGARKMGGRFPAASLVRVHQIPPASAPIIRRP